MRTHFLAIRPISLSFFLLFSMASFSQKQRQWSSGEILHQMKQLNVLGVVLYVAAHPDDENTRLIAYMARVRQYRTGYLAMTRGDGGQNLIGDEQGVELGLIRTQELLAARRVDGGEQFFTRAFDFGYSKRTEEALGLWEKEKVLSDAVWVIRRFQPDIIVARFPEDSRAGHGHHSGSAVIAHEAFFAAADPNRYPEQFQHGVKPWKAKRILWNTFSFGTTSTTSENQMKIEVGDYLPLLGKSIGEISAESRSQHRSQGFGSAATRGPATEYFVHVDGDKASVDPMDGINTSWDRIEGTAGISTMIDQLIASFNPSEPSASVPLLLQIRTRIQLIPNDYWKQQKSKEVDQLILMCAGLHLEALADKKQVRQGDTLKVGLTINNRSGFSVQLMSADLQGLTSSATGPLKQNVNWSHPFQLPIPLSLPVSQPYWLVNPMNTGHFNVTDQQLIGKAENDPALNVSVQLKLNESELRVAVPVRYRNVDPAIGEFFHPVTIVPRTVETGWMVRTIDYEHIPSLMHESKLPVVHLPPSLATTGKRIGYIVGAGDKVPGMIEQMGFEVVELGRTDITADKLKSFDAVVVGVRAYNVHEWLVEKYGVLMEYVRAGGNMVVQYNTNSFAGPLVKMTIGPKPFMISRGRITEEDADVRFVDPKDPVLHYPNTITSDDFKGWIQERGIYFADNFSADYRAVLSMHDKDESDLNGSLIVRNEGKGRFIYTGLVFFRQLPAGVPGAFRLFANLISNPNLPVNARK
ncbi:MAG: PIG-L family deacetylase [Bacteroidetes bacterium]|nr:PIG-L family deacetylase [Bacteroidota bacterium]